MAFKMKGHSLPGPYQKKGDPVPEKMDKIKSEPLISPAEHAKNTKDYYDEFSHYKGRKLHVPSSSKNPKSWSASGKLTSESGMRDKKLPQAASTVDKRFSTAKDKKSLKRPLQKKGDPKVSKSQAKSANKASGNVTLTKTRKDGSVRKTISSTTSGPSQLSGTTSRKAQGVKTKTTKTKFKKDGSVKKTKTLKAPRRKTRGSQEQYLKARENLYQKGDLVSDTKVKRKKS